MKRLALLLVILSSFECWAVIGHSDAADACVNPGGGAPATIYSGKTISANSTVWVGFAGGGSTDNTVTVSSSLGATFTRRILVSGTYELLEGSYVSGGTDTLTINNGGVGLFGQACAYIFTGVSGGFDAAHTTPNTGTGTSVTLSAFTTTSGDLQVAIVSAAGGSDSCTGLTKMTNQLNSSFNLYWGTSSGSSSSLSCTLQFSVGTWNADMVTSLVSGGGGGATVQCTRNLLGVGSC